MTPDSWIALFTAAIGGGVTVKLIEILYEERRSGRAKRLADSEAIERSFEPLLKAADELAGKLRSLGEQDFLPIKNARTDDLSDTDFAGLVYLFVQFWAEIELNRMSRFSSTTGRSDAGTKAQQFFACLESRRVRLVDRITQRAIGEVALRGDRAVTFVDFVKAYEDDDRVRRWTRQLLTILGQTRNTADRQSLLQYLTVVQAMIDTLDPMHLVTRRRPALPNKLSKRSRADLTYRVFGVYLSFVADRAKYIGPPKRRP